jgi:serpin B
MSRRIAASAVFSVVWIIWLLGQASSAPPDKQGGRGFQVPEEQLSTVVEAVNQFAFDLYQRLRAEDRNLCFSPASISTALAMTYAGAAEKTEAEIAKTLHFEMPKRQLDDGMRVLLASWKTTDKKQGFRLDVANRLWGEEGYGFRSEFLRDTRTVYGAELGRLDFSSQAEEARQTINRWVEDHTGQRITNLISSSEQLSGARLVLTNAVYFKGEWHKPFYKHGTENEDFHVSVDQKLKIQMMHAQDQFNYAAVDGLQLVQLPYGDGSLSMVVLLPDTVAGLSQLEEQLSPANLRKWTDSLVNHEVNVSLPKFKTTTEMKMGNILKSMGMVSAFDGATADFSGMTGAKDLFISDVIHKAFVEVNEEGTEAAAATAVVMVECSASFEKPQKPLLFNANHPFVFLIRDDRTGAILFLGRILDPSR